MDGERPASFQRDALNLVRLVVIEDDRVSREIDCRVGWIFKSKRLIVTLGLDVRDGESDGSGLGLVE